MCLKCFNREISEYVVLSWLDFIPIYYMDISKLSNGNK